MDPVALDNVGEPLGDQYGDLALAGDTARLLLLGPHWSGKSHIAYTALRRLLTAGYREEDITVHRAGDLTARYEPGLIENTTTITVIDDVTLSVDLVRESTMPGVSDSAESRP